MNAPKYWPITDFSQVVGSETIAVLVAYFDESGTSANDQFTVVGGAVARNWDWYFLERPWHDLLKSFGLTWYHAVDCEHRKNDFAEFERPIREAITNGLSIELSKFHCQAFGSAVWRKDFNEAPRTIRDRCNDDPFFLCVELCLQQVSDWAANFQDERVAVVFARQIDYQARTKTIFEAYASAERWGATLGSLTIGDPRLLVPLQAADLFAYEFSRYAIDQKKLPIPPRRPAWNYLDNGRFAASFMAHNLESLKKVAADRDERVNAANASSSASY